MAEQRGKILRRGPYLDERKLALELIRIQTNLIRQEIQRQKPDWGEIVRRGEQIVIEAKKAQAAGEES